ncbi:MAG: DMT family transporter [Rhodocyclaceae bacterium]
MSDESTAGWRANAPAYAKLLLTMVFWGGTWVAARFVVQEVPPLTAAAYRFFVACLCLGALLWAEQGHLPRLDRRQWLAVALLGLTGIFAYNIFFLYGMQHISAGRGALVVALNPAVAALVAWLGFGDAMTPLRGAGVVLAMVGCLFVIGNGDPLAPFQGEIGLGELMILGCVVCWTAYTFIGRSATRTLSPLAATTYGCFAGWLMLCIAAALDGALFVAPDFSWRAWTGIVFLGLFGTALGFTWFNAGVKRIGPARASAFINLVPVFAVLLGVVLLGERLNSSVLFGGALVIGGVILANRRVPARVRLETAA